MLERTSTMTMIQTNVYSKWMPWIVCCSTALFFTYELIQMHMFSAINQDLMREYHLSGVQLANLSSIYLWANVIFLFPAGIILDRVSTKRLILLAMSICVLGTFLFAYVEHVGMAYLSRFFTGIGSAFCLLSCVRIATRWFPSGRMALVTGLIVTIAMFGGVFAQTPMTKLTEYFGWRNALWIDGFIGIGVMLVIAYFVRDYPKGQESAYEDRKRMLQQIGFWKSIRLSYFKLQNWLAAIYTSTMNMPIIVLGALWGTLYLTQVHQLARTDAATVNMMIFIGTIIGGPLMGSISDKLGKRRPVMIIGALLSLALIVMVMQVPQLTINQLLLIFFALGLSSSTQVIGYPIVSESNAPIVTATAVSIVSIITQGGGAGYQPLFGKLLESHWNQSIQDGVSVYSHANFNDALMLLVVGFVVAIIAALCLRETHCRQVMSFE